MQKILKYIILVSHFPTLANGMKFGSQPRLECLNIFVMLTEEKGPGGVWGVLLDCSVFLGSKSNNHVISKDDSY